MSEQSIVAPGVLCTEDCKVMPESRPQSIIDVYHECGRGVAMRVPHSCCPCLGALWERGSGIL